MTATRRAFLAATAACLMPLAALAQAQYPAQPVRMIVPYPAGGATDVIARALSDGLTTSWGRQVFVENKPGAGTTLAASQVARAPGDGYTLYMTTSAHTIAGSIYKKIDFDPVADFAALSLLAKVPLVLVVRPTLGVRTLADFTKLAKDPNNKLSYASPGNGTAQHLTGEMFKVATKSSITHVPYRGDAPAVTDLLGGNVDAMFATLTTVLPHIASGKVTALAIANGKRIEKVPEIPTFAEAGLDKFEASTWFGVLAPASMPGPLRQRISDEIVKLVSEPEMRKRLIELGGEIVGNRPVEFDAFMREEMKKWKDIVKASGATID